MNTRGIGLGLSIVKQIVEQSGGKLSAHSDGPNHGSLFCFSMKMDYQQEIIEKLTHSEENNECRVRISTEEEKEAM